MKYLVAILLFLFSMTAQAQIMQVNTAPGGYQFRALKADTMLIAPRGDTSAIGWTKWGVGTNGALHFRTADTMLYVRFNNKWYPVGSGGTGGGGGGTITNISFRAGTVVDTLYFTDSGGDTDFYYVVVKDGLISGGVVTYTGFARTYAISAALFRKNGQFYTTNDTTITIAALSNPDSSRSDVFVVNTSGQATTLTGVESANPLTPQIDPDTEVYLTHVTLSPSAPSAGIDTVVVYDDTVWTVGASGVTVNFGATSNQWRSTYAIDVSAINSGDIIGFGNNAPLNRTDYAGISLYLKLKATMPNNNNILVSFFNGNTQVSSEVALPITKSNTTSYQGLSLGFDAFTFTNNLFDSVRFRYNGSGITGLYLDFIYLQNGMAPVVINPGTDFVQNIRRVGDNIEQQKNGVWTPVIDISDKKSGTVTSVATNTATGITGGTITTTGTLAIDTTIISTRAWRNKLADSLGLVKLNISDTATMMSNAVRGAYRKAGSDSVFTYDAGGTQFAFRDSIGGGGGLTSDSLAVRKSGQNLIHITSWNSWYNSATVGSSSAAARVDSANLFIGLRAGAGGTTGYRNIAFGRASLKSNTTGYANIAIGDSAAGNSTITGPFNIGIGSGTLYGLTSGDYNINIGYNTKTHTTARGTIQIGGDMVNAPGSVTGLGNILIGWRVNGATLSGTNNVFIGSADNLTSGFPYRTGYNTTSGTKNVAVGSGALPANNTGNNNTAVGAEALTSNTSGYGNVGIGKSAGIYLGTGAYNVAIGELSMNGNNANLINSNYSVGIGYYALSKVNGGAAHTGDANNVGIGAFSGTVDAGARNNTFIGHASGTGAASTTTGVSGSGNFALGAGAALPSLSSNNQVQFWVGGLSGGYNVLTRFTGGQWLINNTTSAVTAAPNTSAALEINGTTGALIVPRLTTAQRDALTAAAGMIIFNTTTSKFQGYDGAAWQDFH